jgi:hypothetical protein
VEVGDIVIIHNEGHRLAWKLKRVIELLPSRYDQVRADRLHTKTGETTRALSKLHPLMQGPEVRQGTPAAGEEEQPAAGEDPVPAASTPTPDQSGPRRSTRAAAADAWKKIRQCIID